MSARCTNDLTAKAREVVAAIGEPESNAPYAASMRALFERGAFRHAVDVAYALLMLERGDGVDAIEDEIEKTYRELSHRCDPVYPS